MRLGGSKANVDFAQSRNEKSEVQEGKILTYTAYHCFLFDLALEHLCNVFLQEKNWNLIEGRRDRLFLEYFIEPHIVCGTPGSLKAGSNKSSMGICLGFFLFTRPRMGRARVSVLCLFCTNVEGLSNEDLLGIRPGWGCCQEFFRNEQQRKTAELF